MAKEQKANGEAAKVEQAVRFGKAQLIAAKRYARFRDALGFLLQDGGEYSIAEADGLLEEWLKSEPQGNVN